MFLKVFPYKNKLGNFIMETKKVHAMKQNGGDVCNYGNPMNGTVTAAVMGLKHLTNFGSRTLAARPIRDQHRSNSS